MPHRFSLTALCAICCVTLSLAAFAGPLAPCIAATLSQNGKVLVWKTLSFDDPDETHARYPRTSTFQVMTRDARVDQGHLRGPNTYWDDPLWSVVLSDVSCPFTLVTDDAEYLVILGEFRRALTIYRRGDNHGILVRQIALAALWPAERVPEGRSDGSPEWFSSGDFAFSSNNQFLIYKTAWGKTLTIELATGAIISKQVDADRKRRS